MSFRFEDLKVYQKTLNFVDVVYKAIEEFPNTEVYALASQFKRAAVSILLNIAEGTGRSKKEFGHFLDMSRTSAYECVACLEIALRRRYISANRHAEMYNELNKIVKMLNALKNSLL